MWQYKIAQEFIGADGFSQGYIQDTKTRNVENDPPAPIPTRDKNGSENSDHKEPFYPPVCKHCKQPLLLSEFQERYREDTGEYIYRCKKCKKGNDPFERTVTRVKHKKSFSNKMIKEAVGNANPGQSGMSNPANTPFGRTDLSMENRMVPWGEIEQGFNEEWDHQKQKRNYKYRIKKIKGKDGSVKIVRIRVKDTDGEDPIQQSNIFNEKGKVKNQPRYRNDKNKNKNRGDGAWPHNRNPETEGWYGAEEWSSAADMDNRIMLWDDYIRDRNKFMMTLTRPS